MNFKTLAITTLASLSLIAPSAEAAPNFYRVGLKWGREICKTYNVNDTYTKRMSDIETASFVAFLTDGEVARMMMNNISPTDYQINQLSLGMTESLFSTCPLEAMPILEDSMNMDM